MHRPARLSARKIEKISLPEIAYPLQQHWNRAGRLGDTKKADIWSMVAIASWALLPTVYSACASSSPKQTSVAIPFKGVPLSARLGRSRHRC